MNICILIIDCLRADHLGCYGYKKPTSPVIDAIAEDSMVFEHASSQANWTYPSLYSMMTGRYPSSLRISWWDQRVNENVPLMQDTLAKKGYKSGLLTSFMGLLNPDCFCSHFDEALQLKIKDDLPANVDKWVKSHDDSLLLLHIGEYTHEPFHADREVVERFLDNTQDIEKVANSKSIHPLISKSVESKNMRKAIAKINLKLSRLSKREIEYLLAAYDAGITYVDKVVGDLHRVFKESGKDYLFAITADHGQAFMEHGVFGHGLTLYEEQTHVPLIMDLNGKYKGRVSTPVQLMDLYPTIMDIAGVSVDHIVDGDSMWPLFNGGAMPDRACISEGYPYISVQENNYKLITKHSRLTNYDEIYSPIANSWKRKLLSRTLHYLPDKIFSLKDDPGEKKNLIRKRMDIVDLLRKKIDESAMRFTLENLPAAEVGINEEIERQLKELGYL
ncbi:MAG TPA: hypothetical protein ENG75_05660 [Nitrospirae bacterium]|nr:hypothetical protein [Nitrospirota bacterium]HDK17407.1 hypothetical protein [Nitrospirota bacterium]